MVGARSRGSTGRAVFPVGAKRGLRSVARLGAAFLVLVTLAGCVPLAQGARSDAMISPAAALRRASLPKDLEGAVTIGVVSGGEETNPLWTSEVGNDAFRAALEQNLILAGMRARDDSSAAYRLDATIVGVDQPVMGLDLKVTSTVQYAMTPLAGGKPFSTLVVESFTATFADAALGVERLRLANEGSIRRNIETFIDRLVAHYGRSADRAAAGAAKHERRITVTVQRG